MAIHHQENLTKLANIPGIITAGSRPGGAVGSAVVLGDMAHRDLLLYAIDLFTHADDNAKKKPIRVAIGNLTILVVDFGHERAGVIFPTGDPVAKSIQRALRRLARKTPKRPADASGKA